MHPQRFRPPVLALCVLFWMPAHAQAQAPAITVVPQDSNSSASLRGLSVVSDRVVWTSGENGTVLRTLDSGETWNDVSVPKSNGLDFRSLHAFDANHALVISAGSPAITFLTKDGGKTWSDTYQNDHADVFVDAIAFWDGNQGLAFGDPMDGRLLLVETKDGGQIWADRQGPKTEPGEAAFAASCSCLATQGKSNVWIGLGGGLEETKSRARVLRSQDRGATWSAATTPMVASASGGIFSLTFWSAQQGIAVGGDFEAPDDSTSTICLTNDGGITWSVPTGTLPRGYRSAVAEWNELAKELAKESGNVRLDNRRLVCVGTNGSDLSVDSGQSWRRLNDQPYHTVAFSKSGRYGWSTGSDGRIGRWQSTLTANERIAPPALPVAARPLGGHTPGSRLKRTGDEIMVCGQLFHTTTRVVLWTDPGGYDAYRVERRFAPYDQASWKRTKEQGEAISSPNRYGLRESELSENQIEQVRGGNWDLDLLQSVVDQFVIHYDVCGTSRRCFKVLHDMRGLSIHFMLDIDGTIYQTLDLKERAWHATISNSRSIGIEIANIGAYPPDDMRALNQWYGPDGKGGIRITLPESMRGGGVRMPNFIGRPRLPNPIHGTIQGTELVQYDLTAEQYDALIRLTATLCTVFPKLECRYPQDEAGELIPRKLDKEAWSDFHGILGHYHIQKNKTDPGPAFQWDMLIDKSRELLQ